MSKIKKQNRRAFTLTELLIVVIVIGVLSAVTLPKFNRVIENRKVTEAEEMMSAVRMEQERRCTLDQNYTTNFDSLSDVIASANTKNYTYSLQAQGISAKSTSGDYTLKILSYEDGSYCCTGDGCKKLNKNYPDCATLSFPASNCAGTEGGEPGEPEEPVAPECTNGQVKGSQACNGCGTQTTQKCVNGKWTNVLGACSKTAEECAPECTDGAVSGSQTCNGCGTQTTQKCVGGKWKDVLGECSKTQEECSTCTEGSTRQSETSCGSGCGVVLEACIKGKWQGVNCVPKSGAECTPSISNQEKCPDGTYRRRTCNTATCKWGAWDKECSAQDCSNAAYKASHKAECCPGTPDTDEICWKKTYAWGPRTSVPVNTTVTYNAYYVQTIGAERCTSNKALTYKSVYPDIVNSSASSIVRCPGNDGSSVKGRSCSVMYLGTGEPQDTYCFYSLGTGYEYTSGVGFRGCKLIEERNGDICECTINAWPGHKCVLDKVEKNGW